MRVEGSGFCGLSSTAQVAKGLGTIAAPFCSLCDQAGLGLGLGAWGLGGLGAWGLGGLGAWGLGGLGAWGLGGLGA